VVLMMALIVLVAMTLAGIALVRSVDTTNIVAGNLAFQQAATNSADAASEVALTWLNSNNSGNTLFGDIYASAYSSKQENPTAGQSWDNYWNTVLVPSGQVVSLAMDAAGNTASYNIQRLCLLPNLAPTAVGAQCAVPQAVAGSSSSSKTAGTVALLYTGQVFYRITIRVAGPRNTVSYVQTMVSM
jgi:Tfp pilus assembly protein PilX